MIALVGIQNAIVLQTLQAVNATNLREIVRNVKWNETAAKFQSRFDFAFFETAGNCVRLVEVFQPDVAIENAFALA
jgi:hypothetical protein